MASKSSRRVRPPDRNAAVHVRRGEFDRLADSVDKCSHAIEVQFTRIAQLQAELDLIRIALGKVPLRSHRMSKP